MIRARENTAEEEPARLLSDFMAKEAVLPNGTLPENEEKPSVFTGKEVSRFHSILTMVLWLGPIYFGVFAVLASLLFLSTFNASIVLGLLLILALIPVDGESKLGRRLARFLDHFSFSII